MKLLGWMHRKLRRHCEEPKPHSCWSPDRWLCSENHEDPPIVGDDRLFHGILSIGTLGGSPTAGDDLHGTVTPTFGTTPPAVATVESIAKEDHSGLDLVVLSSELELEKVLVAPEDNRLSSVSARQLLVSGCPFQVYLLESPVVAAETAEKQMKVDSSSSRRRRKSLVELFTSRNLIDDGGGGVDGSGEEGKKQNAPSGAQTTMMKKMLKRLRSGHLRPSSTAFGVGGDELDRHECRSGSKFQKIIRLFHGKVHPESSVSSGEKSRKPAGKSTRGRRGGGGGGGGGAGASFLVSGGACATGKVPWDESVATSRWPGGCRCSTPAETDPAGGVSGESGGYREQWIKTDTEYVVLEL